MPESADAMAWLDDREYGGWRGDLGIPELALIIRNVRHTRNPKALAKDFERLNWPADEALTLAQIVARVSEIVLSPARERRSA